jgi:hypothetical protein
METDQMKMDDEVLQMVISIISTLPSATALQPKMMKLP